MHNDNQAGFDLNASRTEVTAATSIITTTKNIIERMMGIKI